MTRRVHIERLKLDLRGIDPKTAEAAVRQIGPSLQKELAQRRGGLEAAHRVDAGVIAPSSTSHEIASNLAHRIAQRVRRS